MKKKFSSAIPPTEVSLEMDILEPTIITLPIIAEEENEENPDKMVEPTVTTFPIIAEDVNEENTMVTGVERPLELFVNYMNSSFSSL